MFFISFGGRNYRRMIYSQRGIPPKIADRIEYIRTAQIARLRKNFSRTSLGRMLFADVKKKERAFVRISRKKMQLKSKKKFVRDAEQLAVAREAFELSALSFVDALLHYTEGKKGIFPGTIGEIKNEVARQGLRYSEAKQKRKNRTF